MTRSTPEVELQRSRMALDWLVRAHAPAWLDLVPALSPHAAALRGLAPLVDDDACVAATPTLAAARAAAGAAADDAASAWDAWEAGNVAGAAWEAGNVGGAAAREAGDAALDVAWDARAAETDDAMCAAMCAASGTAWSAAWYAARAASMSASRDDLDLRPIVERLQADWSRVLLRMCEVES